ncbi:cytochrome oxidase assembly [Hysterangium stoloniferum]|nr:cytochrome oxidase assembly [Hysterangium stoloniferum]
MSLRPSPLDHSRPSNNKPLSGFFFSSNAAASPDALPILSPPSVGYWLLCSSALVFGIVVVGGMTRLTESGLSITEWKPITGIIPPANPSEWEDTFNKYKATPEFKLLNHQMTLPQFKSIFYMEYGHRVLGRLIGVVFVLPYLYFLASKRLTPTLPTKLGGLAALIGLQGFLGWYMVKSGLEDSLMDTPGAVPRVSQYRLAAHLGAAIVLYAGMLSTGMGILRDWKFANTGPRDGTREEGWRNTLKDQRLRRFATGARFLTGLVFLTAISGAFVAGLDAGLVYNEFPTMGGRLAPPVDELFSPAYAQSADQSDMWWRNIFENPTTVQFDHRLLALTTYTSTAALFLATLRPSLRALLPPITHQLAAGAFAMVNLQVVLGISTLLYMVPLPIAATHQAGSVALLTVMIALMTSLRRPGVVAQLWRNAQRAKGR